MKYKGRDTTRTPQEWEAVYLGILRDHGNMSKAALIAGTTNPKVKKFREEHPDFDACWLEAMDHYLDRVEQDLGEMKNPIAKIARLRADRPSRYLDKLQVAGAVAHLHAAPPPEEVNALLREMLGASRPATRAQITGTVDAPDTTTS